MHTPGKNSPLIITEAENQLLPLKTYTDREINQVLKFVKKGCRQEVYLLPEHQALVRAVRLLGYFKNKKIEKTLEQLLKSGQYRSFSDWQLELRMAAATGLVRSGTPEALETLLTCLAIEEAAPLREVIIEGLSQRRDEASFGLLVKALTCDWFEERAQVWRRQAGAGEALGRSGNRQAVPALLPLAGSEFPAVRVAAIRALAQLQAPEARSLVAGLLNDRAAEVRQAAAEALERLN